MKAKFDWLLPKFMRVPVLVAVLFNFFVYLAPSRLFVTDVVRYDLSIGLDRMLPCIPAFLLIYVLAYVQWVFSYVWHCRDSERLTYHLCTANIVAKSLCLLCFIFLPTQIVRPEITGDGLFSWGLRLVYTIDDPVNLFPSIHCVESWMCFRTAMMLHKKTKWYITAQGIFTLLVFASIVLVKQHFVLDIFAGVLVCEIGLFLSKRFGLWRLFRKLQPSWAKE